LWLGPSPKSGKEEKVGGEERGGMDINEFDQELLGYTFVALPGRGVTISDSDGL
jgi:hypothetical protein